MNEFPNPGERAETAPGLSVADVLYVVFRHKLKILIIAATGAIGMAVTKALETRHEVLCASRTRDISKHA